MGQATRSRGKKKQKQVFFDAQLKKRLREVLFLALSAGTIFLLLALCTYSSQDVAWSHAHAAHASTHNLAGKWGAYVSDLGFYLFGYMAYAFPLWTGFSAFRILKNRRVELNSPHWGTLAFQILGALLSIIAATVLLTTLLHDPKTKMPVGAGGVTGDLFHGLIYPNLNLEGSVLFTSFLFLVGLTLALGISWVKLLDQISLQIAQSIREHQEKLKKKRREHREKPVQEWPSPAIQPVNASEKPKRVIAQKPVLVLDPEPIAPTAPMLIPKPIPKPKKIVPLKPGAPPLDLLEEASDTRHFSGHSAEALEQLSRLVEQRLADFNVQAQVVGVCPGPVITRFEIQLAAGIKVSKISGLAKDLARSLSVISVRVVEVIPGKPFIGLELPNPNRAVVRLREIFEAPEYGDAASPLSLALGKDIAGHPVVVDLSKMPHLLVAGTTGSGKSVGINAMLISLLYKASPEEVRLILVDPKMLELSVYEGIPHLLAPVVTDMKDAAYALKWCVMEMERRYRLMAALGVRNVMGFNRKLKDALEKGQEIPNPFPDQGDAKPTPLTPLPYIVVVIDEFADMMMVVGRKVEDLIARIAQKARAAGIHLILATQRPSVDVITGLIKANIPTRIAFQVSSRIDSRTILDQQGAEQLLGHGDMLYLPPGTGIPIRVHGAFVADQEVHAVVKDWRSRGEPQYEEAITTQTGGGDGLSLNGGWDDEADAEQDTLYDEAVQFVMEARRVSVSSIQRRFKIGYNRAARIVDQMERAGLVSAMQHNGTREVMVPGDA